MSKQLQQHVEEALLLICQYYQQSFVVSPEQCNPLLISFIDNMQTVCLRLKEENLNAIAKYLGSVLDAMEQQDHVLVRDYLFYEIQPLLQRID